MIDFSAASDQIFMILDLLESSHSDSDVNFIISALFKKFFNTQNFNKI